MGQAKLRSKNKEHFEQSKEKARPPKAGLYISTRTKPGVRMIVDEVSEADEDGFFLLTLLSEAAAKDMSAMGQELTSEEWFSFAEEYGLIYSQS